MSKITVEFLKAEKKVANSLRKWLEKAIEEGNHRIIFEELSERKIKSLRKEIDSYHKN